MKFTIGTLSFARCGDAFLISPKERIRLVRVAAYAHCPNVLLTAGHVVHSRKHLAELAAGIAEDGAGTTIVTEVHHDGVSRARRLSGHALYAIFPNGSWRRLGRQIFARREETQGEEAWRVPLFIDRMPRRAIDVEGRRIFVMACGELNVVQGRRDPAFIASEIENTLSDMDIILNPTHDRMGWPNMLDAKRRFLSHDLRSSRSKTYVSCSNWNIYTEVGTSQHATSAIHSCYVDGESVEPTDTGGGEEWGFLYRNYVTRSRRWSKGMSL